MAHESYDRLIAALTRYGREPNQTQIAAWINTNPQTIHNWARRGVSKDGALDIQRIKGVSATWILDGIQPMMVGDAVSQPVRISSEMLSNAIKFASFSVTRYEQRPLDLNVATDIEIIAEALMGILEDTGNESGSSGTAGAISRKSGKDNKRGASGASAGETDTATEPERKVS